MMYLYNTVFYLLVPSTPAQGGPGAAPGNEPTKEREYYSVSVMCVSSTLFQ